jgi:hypothetical protein
MAIAITVMSLPIAAKAQAQKRPAHFSGCAWASKQRDYDATH